MENAKAASTGGEDLGLNDQVAKADTSRPNEPDEEARLSTDVAGAAKAADTTGMKIVATSHSELQGNLQKLIDEINEKRKRDTEMVNDFRKTVDMHVNKASSMLEEAIVDTYETHNKAIQEKLQELFKIMERIAKLESELLDFKRALGLLYTDVQAV